MKSKKCLKRRADFCQLLGQLLSLLYSSLVFIGLTFSQVSQAGYGNEVWDGTVSSWNNQVQPQPAKVSPMSEGEEVCPRAVEESYNQLLMNVVRESDDINLRGLIVDIVAQAILPGLLEAFTNGLQQAHSHPGRLNIFNWNFSNTQSSTEGFPVHLNVNFEVENFNYEVDCGEDCFERYNDFYELFDEQSFTNLIKTCLIEFAQTHYPHISLDQISLTHKRP